ncbi:MAG: hypothetical protein ACR2IJ_05440 [Fluviibacter sp.]
MTTAFETLYYLAVDLQTNPDYRHLTSHHDVAGREEVERRLRESILTLNMPGEGLIHRWDRVRVFCRNLVNRAQPAVREADVKRVLEVVENDHHSYEDRVVALPEIASSMLTGRRADGYVSALRKIASDQVYSELGNLTLLEWIDQRWAFWVGRPIEDLDVDELLYDIDVLSVIKSTKIEGMGLPLAANFFADIGLRVFAKPDLHVTPIINMLQLRYGESAAFRGLVEIAQAENDLLSHNRRFNWLMESGGLYPRYLDRIIYLIGSDNYSLDGVKNKRQAPKRRELMRDSLVAAGLIQARYSGQLY